VTISAAIFLFHRVRRLRMKENIYRKRKYLEVTTNMNSFHIFQIPHNFHLLYLLLKPPLWAYPVAQDT